MSALSGYVMSSVTNTKYRGILECLWLSVAMLRQIAARSKDITSQHMMKQTDTQQVVFHFVIYLTVINNILIRLCCVHRCLCLSV